MVVNGLKATSPDFPLDFTSHSTPFALPVSLTDVFSVLAPSTPMMRAGASEQADLCLLCTWTLSVMTEIQRGNEELDLLAQACDLLTDRPVHFSFI